MGFGWTVLRVTKTMINDGTAIALTKKLLEKQIKVRNGISR